MSRDFLVALNPGVAAKNTQELIALAKARPRALNYGSAGVGAFTHFATELFDFMAGTRMTHVPYKGSGPALTDLFSGQLQSSFIGVPVAVPHAKTGRIRAIAVTAAKRIAAMPDVPPIAGAVPGYETILWYRVLGPKGLSKSVLARWSAEVAATLQSPEVRERLTAEGFEVGDTRAACLLAVIKRDIAQ